MIPPTLYFVALIQKEGNSSWTKVGEWNYDWTAPGNKTQELVDFNPLTSVSPGKNTILLMAFRNGVPATLPNLPLNYRWLPLTNTGNADLFDWVSTSFSVPRMIQPGDKAYFPGGNTFSLSPGDFELGLRNLSPVDQLILPDNDGNPFVHYRLTLVKGDPSKITINGITCNEGSYPMVVPCPIVAADTTWQSLPGQALEFKFSKVLPEINYTDGKAPKLNAIIKMAIGKMGDYEFKLVGLTDVPGTAIDETTLNENLGASLEGASIESLTAENAVVNENAAIALAITNPSQLSASPTVKVFNAETNEEVAIISPITKETNYSLAYMPTTQGNFRVDAKLEQPCKTCEKSAFFSANQAQRIPVPETSLPAVALMALSVLAVVAFAGRKK
jgi:hypothetical protein